MEILSGTTRLRKMLNVFELAMGKDGLLHVFLDKKLCWCI